PELRTITLVEEDGAHGQRWEQMRLPRLSSDGVLVNLCNLAPLRHRRQLMLIHDAQFLFPDSGYPLRQRFGYRFLVPRMARASETVLTVSDYSRQMLDVLGVIPRERTQVLYNGADHIIERPANTAVLDKFKLDKSGYVLLFGSSKPYKNTSIIFEAMEKVPNKALVIVGSSSNGFQKGRLRNPGGPIFVGSVDDPSLRALYENAHCLAFPSRTEGFGLPPVEAMLCRCPVIASPGGAIPEICRNVIDYADVDDADGWADAISSVNRESFDLKTQAAHDRGWSFTWANAGLSLSRHIAKLL
ncbi:MAG: glycosyltransferase family 1 protein, partial [Hymenobacter sp.]